MEAERTEERWAALSREWAELLPRFGTLRRDGSRHFKMSEMQMSAHRKENVRPFLRVIERHVQSYTDNKVEYARASLPIHRPEVVHSGVTNMSSGERNAPRHYGPTIRT